MKAIIATTLLLACLQVFTGCRALTSAAQENQNSSFNDTMTVQGRELKLQADLVRQVHESGKIDLTGTLTVTATDGKMPQSLDLYHLALKPSKSGYYVKNYRRNQDNSWHYPAPNKASGSFQAQLQRTPHALIVTFQFLSPNSIFTKSSDYDVMDLTVSLRDDSQQRHALSIKPQQVRLEASSR